MNKQIQKEVQHEQIKQNLVRYFNGDHAAAEMAYSICFNGQHIPAHGGESAATPPDVEQLADEVLKKHIGERDVSVLKEVINGTRGNVGANILAALVEMYQAGQSAVQDATPGEAKLTPQQEIEHMSVPTGLPNTRHGISQDATPQEWDEWKSELIKIVKEKTGESEIVINEAEAKEWFNDGVSPYMCFRETFKIQ